MSTKQESPITILATGVAITAATSSASQTISVPHGRIVVTNTGSVFAYFRSGVGAQTAVTTDYPLPPGSQQTITVPTDTNTAAAITESGTARVIVTSVIGE